MKRTLTLSTEALILTVLIWFIMDDYIVQLVAGMTVVAFILGLVKLVQYMDKNYPLRRVLH